MKYQAELDCAILAARKAQKKILEIYNEDLDIKIKSDNTPVTKADLAANEIILKELSKFDYHIISEETKDDEIRLTHDLVWIVDPIDGTKDFIKKSGDFVIHIALAREGEVVLGVVCAPVYDKLYYAIENQGAYLIDKGNSKPKKLVMPHKKKFEDSIMLISNNKFRDEDRFIAEKLGVKKFKNVGSLGLKLCFMAEGLADLTIITINKFSEWDIAAPEIILIEAGGCAFDNSGNNFTYNKKNLKHENGLICLNNHLEKKEVLQHLN